MSFSFTDDEKLCLVTLSTYNYPFGPQKIDMIKRVLKEKLK
jgi:hypothetical protein